MPEPSRARNRASADPRQALLHHRRGERPVRGQAARAALLGAGVHAAEAGQAPRQPPLLPAPRSAADPPHPRPALRAGLHHQRRAPPAPKARPPSRAPPRAATSRAPRQLPSRRPARRSPPRCAKMLEQIRQLLDLGPEDVPMPWRRLGRLNASVTHSPDTSTRSRYNSKFGRGVAQPGSAPACGVQGVASSNLVAPTANQQPDGRARGKVYSTKRRIVYERSPSGTGLWLIKATQLWADDRNLASGGRHASSRRIVPGSRRKRDPANLTACATR